MISSPYAVFTDLDGTPLEGGYIYVGNPGFDPELYPYSLTWVGGGAAAQPVRTIGGYPSQAGSPGRLNDPSSYSIRVRNKNGEVVFTSLNETGASATYLKLIGGTVYGEILSTVNPSSASALTRRSWIEANFLPLAGGTMSGPISYATLPSLAAHLVNKQYADSLVPPGAFMYMAFTGTIPTGWLLCNGAAVSRTTYATLFAAIGTAWGTGDGVSTFNLPEGRGEFMRGFDNGRGIDSGRVFGVSQAEMIGPHTHPMNGFGITLSAGSTGTICDNPGGAGTFTKNTSNNSGTENRPRNITGNLLIKF